MPEDEKQPDTPNGKLHQQMMDYLQSWWEGTKHMRPQMQEDFAFMDGQQWKDGDVEKLVQEERPVLTFNEVQPQVELVAGVFRGIETTFIARPRGEEDKDLAELATASIRAAQDFMRLSRVRDRAKDDATIGGLGVIELLHTKDDTDDVIWGDVIAARVNPLSFIWDPWAIDPDWQDGEFMGKGTWMTESAFKTKFPKSPPPKSGEWLSQFQGKIGDSESLGTGPSLAEALFDVSRGRIRLVTLYYKVMKEIAFLVNDTTGEVEDNGTRKAMQTRLTALARERAERDFQAFTVETAEDGTAGIINAETGAIAANPNNPEQELRFGSAADAVEFLEGQIAQRASLYREPLKVITRKVREVRWVEMNAWDIVKKGTLDHDDRLFPYATYVSRQYRDDPASIQGLIRQTKDRQREINKRYSNLLDHLTRSSHSGWLLRQGQGAARQQLEQMGGKAGVVVEYTSVKPEKIEPSQISTGHFQLLQANVIGLQRATGVNAELLGNTTQQTVSGRAINARQQGGLTILKPRLKNYDESDLDLAKMVLSRVQQFYPPEKLKRIIGVAELNKPLGENGRRLFTHPVTGAPLSEDLIFERLERFSHTPYDLVLDVSDGTGTERQAKFEQGVQVMGLVTSTGRPVGPRTIEALADLTDLPVNLTAAIKEDLQQEANPEVTAAGGQNSQIQGAISNIRGGRAGGNT